MYYGHGFIEYHFGEFFPTLKSMPRFTGHMGILGTQMFYSKSTDTVYISSFGSADFAAGSVRTLIQVLSSLQRIKWTIISAVVDPTEQKQGSIGVRQAKKARHTPKTFNRSMWMSISVHAKLKKPNIKKMCRGQFFCENYNKGGENTLTSRLSPAAKWLYQPFGKNSNSMHDWQHFVAGLYSDGDLCGWIDAARSNTWQD